MEEPSSWLSESGIGQGLHYSGNSQAQQALSLHKIFVRYPKFSSSASQIFPIRRLSLLRLLPFYLVIQLSGSFLELCHAFT